MRILFILPESLNDTILLAPCLEGVIKTKNKSSIVLLGNKNSLSIYKNNSKIRTTITTKDSYFQAIKQALNLGKFDISIDFENSFKSKLFLKFLKSNLKISFKDKPKEQIHKTQIYKMFLQKCFDTEIKLSKYNLYQEKIKSSTPTIGFNLGLQLDSRNWNIDEFYSLVLKMSSFYKIALFGHNDLTSDLSARLKSKNIKNYEDYSNKNINTQIKIISSLEALISTDDWASQVASAYNIPSIIIYGSSNIAQTSPYLHNNTILLSKNLYCSPCNKSKCPIKSHDCMQQIKAKDVYNAYTKLKTNFEITIQKV